MCRLKEEELYKLIKGGETLTVEFKIAPPRPVEVAERLCGMANAQGGIPSQKDRLVMAMRYVHEHESITNREHRKLTNVAINTALNDLELLVSQGALKALGKTRGRQYKLP